MQFIVPNPSATDDDDFSDEFTDADYPLPDDDTDDASVDGGNRHPSATRSPAQSAQPTISRSIGSLQS